MKRNFLSELFFSHKRFMVKMQPKLDYLESQLLSVEKIDNKIWAIINLFQAISQLQDEGGFTEELEILNNHRSGKTGEHIIALQNIQYHIQAAGRDLYGMNRTQKGETVLADKVFLGNIFGIWTNTAKHFLDNRKKFEEDFSTDIGKNLEKPISTWEIIHDYQCGNFVKEHINGLKRQIAVLKKF